MEEFLIVTVPVADIRRKPVDARPQYVHDDLQETQVLYNELLLYRDETEDWYYVEAMEQQKIVVDGVFQGYPGWIRKKSVSFIDSLPKYNGVVKEKTAVVRKDPSEKSSALITVSIGTKLIIGESNHPTYCQVIMADGKDGWVRKRDVNILIPGFTPEESTLRKSIIGAAKLFLGAPYLWGGRSIYMPDLQRITHSAKRSGELSLVPVTGSGVPQCAMLHALCAVLTGVDCSSFTNLVYRVNGIDIPRDADDQWATAEKIDCDMLKPGDLIFVSAEGKPDSIAHVLLGAGGEEFFEAEETGSVVSLADFSDKFGADLDRLAERDFKVNNKQISFGRVIPHNEQH